jgi:hypothetical protein
MAPGKFRQINRKPQRCLLATSKLFSAPMPGSIGPVAGNRYSNVFKKLRWISKDDEAMLQNSLFRIGLAKPIPTQRMPCSADGRVLSSWVFAVPHKPASDRPIVDLRPLNAQEAKLRWCMLPYGAKLGVIRLRADKTIRANGDDLSKYSIFSKVRGSGAAGPRSEERHRLLFSLTALEMGDHNAVDEN